MKKIKSKVFEDRGQWSAEEIYEHNDPDTGEDVHYLVSNKSEDMQQAMDQTNFDVVKFMEGDSTALDQGRIQLLTPDEANGYLGVKSEIEKTIEEDPSKTPEDKLMDQWSDKEDLFRDVFIEKGIEKMEGLLSK